MSKVCAVLDQVEKTTEKDAILVTIGSGKKVFSSGMDLKVWAKSSAHKVLSVTMLQMMCAKILTLNVPTLCVFNGHAIAGGAMIGMVHDDIIMVDNSKFMLWLNEINNKVPIPWGTMKLVMET